MSSKKDDILDFLDAKFAKFGKSDKKSKKIKKDKKEQPTTTLLKELQAQKLTTGPKVTQESLYSELVTDQELSKMKLAHGSDSLGVKQLKDFHLKEPNSYEKDLKDKIFFIGQNSIQGKDPLHMEERQSALRYQKRPAQKQTKLSNNTLKTLTKMHS